MALRHGRVVDLDGESFHAFPEPAVLAGLDAFPGVAPEKIARLHTLASTTVTGSLDRTVFREMPLPEALAAAQTLPGVGPFFAQGIVIRGAGVADAVTDDDITRHTVATSYDLAGPVGRPEVLAVAQAWRPYRMWAVVLLHVAARGSGNLPQRRRPKSGPPT
jgi:DNA-3-methyladenine glycosylase II